METHFTRQILHQLCKICSLLPLHLSSPALRFYRTHKIGKIKLVKFVKSFTLPWPKGFPLVEPNLISIPFDKPQLPSSEIITERPML